MATGLSAVLRTIGCAARTRGLRHLRALRHLTTAARDELARARQRLTRTLRATIGGARERCARAVASRLGSPAWSHDTLQLVHDVAASPAPFDLAHRLAAAELERRRRGLGAVVVVFVAAPEGSPADGPADGDAAEALAAQRARLDCVLIPMLALLPSVRSFAVCGSRSEAEALIARDPAKVHPDDCCARLPGEPAGDALLDRAFADATIWPMLRATEAGRQAVAGFLAREANGRRPVVITLRNCDHARSRNGRAKDWLAFADALDPAVYAPVFVHDPEQMLRGPPIDCGRHIVCHAAAWSLDVRMALYESAWLNMAIMHGPLELCRYNEHARYLLFVAPEMPAGAAPEEAGNRLWVDFDFAEPYQRVVWKRAHLAALREAFAEMEGVLLAHPRA
jgi:hypothetical protein